MVVLHMNRAFEKLGVCRQAGATICWIRPRIAGVSYPPVTEGKEPRARSMPCKRQSILLKFPKPD